MPDIGDLLDSIRGRIDDWRFKPSATSITAGFGKLPEGWRGGPRQFIPRADRWFALTVEADMLNLPSLPERMERTLHERLVVNLGLAVDTILDDAKDSLYKPADFPVHRHGYDTGRLHDSLVARLLDEVGVGVWYDLYSDQAEYWVFVEFGRLREDGSWWPGYHFLTSAIMRNRGTLQNAVRVAIHETFTLLASESRVPSGAAMPLPPSASALRPEQGPGGALLEQY
jgi:hypothetical protein